MLQTKTVFSYFHFLYRYLLFLPATTCNKHKKEQDYGRKNDVRLSRCPVWMELGIAILCRQFVKDIVSLPGIL
jgi:hypothetical protein